MASARATAVRCLMQVERDGGYSNLVLDAALQKEGLSPQEAAFCSRLFYGVIERKYTLDHILSAYSKLPPKKLTPEVLQILRCALYQMCWLDSIPDSAAVNEAVTLTRTFRKASASGFVNGVLRAFLRDGKALPPIRGSLSRRLSVQYSCAEPLVKHLVDRYGAERAEGFLAASLDRPPLFLRANLCRTTAEELAALLRQQGAQAEAEPLLEGTVRLSGAGALEKLPAYADGLFHVQDLSSQRCVSALAPKAGERLLDVCSAPGGKSFTAAGLMQGRGEIVACDLYAQKAGLIAQGAERLGHSLIRAVQNDATCQNGALGTFDAVLCDVPCSGLGIIRRKPEIKYKSAEVLSSLCETQYRILTISAGYLRAGGRLLYSTCTLNPAENEETVARFLREHPDFMPLESELLGGWQRTFWPQEDTGDGFFCALLQKKEG